MTAKITPEQTTQTPPILPCVLGSAFLFLSSVTIKKCFYGSNDNFSAAQSLIIATLGCIGGSALSSRPIQKDVFARNEKDREETSAELAARIYDLISDKNPITDSQKTTTKKTPATDAPEEDAAPAAPVMSAEENPAQNTLSTNTDTITQTLTNEEKITATPIETTISFTSKSQDIAMPNAVEAYNEAVFSATITIANKEAELIAGTDQANAISTNVLAQGDLDTATIEDPAQHAPVLITEDPVQDTSVMSTVEDAALNTPVIATVEDVVLDAPVMSTVEDAALNTPVIATVEDVVLDAPVMAIVEDVALDTTVIATVEDVVLDAPVMAIEEDVALDTTVIATAEDAAQDPATTTEDPAQEAPVKAAEEDVAQDTTENVPLEVTTQEPYISISFKQEDIEAYQIKREDVEEVYKRALEKYSIAPEHHPLLEEIIYDIKMETMLTKIDTKMMPDAKIDMAMMPDPLNHIDTTCPDGYHYEAIGGCVRDSSYDDDL